MFYETILYMQATSNISKLLKIGTALFCLMCLFFAINMASKYEHQKTQTEIQRNKVKELEEKIDSLSTANQELLHMRDSLLQEKEQLAKEISSLREKYSEIKEWKLAIEKGSGENEKSLVTQPDTGVSVKKFEETREVFPTNDKKAETQQ